MDLSNELLDAVNGEPASRLQRRILRALHLSMVLEKAAALITQHDTKRALIAQTTDFRTESVVGIKGFENVLTTGLRVEYFAPPDEIFRPWLINLSVDGGPDSVSLSYSSGPMDKYKGDVHLFSMTGDRVALTGDEIVKLGQIIEEHIGPTLRGEEVGPYHKERPGSRKTLEAPRVSG